MDESKAKLIDAGLAPRARVAELALKADVNANRLHKGLICADGWENTDSLAIAAIRLKARACMAPTERCTIRRRSTATNQTACSEQTNNPYDANYRTRCPHSEFPLRMLTWPPHAVRHQPQE